MSVKVLSHSTAQGGEHHHFILETLATAYILEMNLFDQPAVEDGKKLALDYLKAMPGKMV